VTTLYISHRLEEIFDVGDDVTVLRYAEAARQCGRSNVEPDLFQEFGRSAVHCLIVKQAVSARQMLKQQVFRYRQVGKRV
ncbi:hypothetical protein ACC687_41825, partial [Rhizobium ruizarguesonis]